MYFQGKNSLPGGFLEVFHVFGDKCARISESQHSANRLIFAFCQGGIQFTTLAQHGLFNLLGDHRADFPQVFTDLFDFFHCPEKKFQVGCQAVVISGNKRLLFPVPFGDKMINQYIFGLPMAVEATVTLLKAIGISGDFHVDDAMTMILQVNSFRCSIGCQENPDTARFQGGPGKQP